MTDFETVLRWMHVLGASVLFGTGIGIAFFMLLAHRSGNPAVIAHTAGVVVIADTVFTAVAAILQPVTGVLLAMAVGWSLREPWILLSIALYVLVGVCWLPVVRIQIRLRDLAQHALAEGAPLPEAYHKGFRLWFALGIPAFLTMLVLFWVMLTRPVLWG